jgi:hypothetical protein
MLTSLHALTPRNECYMNENVFAVPELILCYKRLQCPVHRNTRNKFVTFYWKRCFSYRLMKLTTFHHTVSRLMMHEAKLHSPVRLHGISGTTFTFILRSSYHERRNLGMITPLILRNFARPNLISSIVLKVIKHFPFLRGLDNLTLTLDSNFSLQLLLAPPLIHLSLATCHYRLYQCRLRRYTREYPKVSGLAAWSENCKWYSSLPLGAVVSLFCETV